MDETGVVLFRVYQVQIGYECRKQERKEEKKERKKEKGKGLQQTKDVRTLNREDKKVKVEDKKEVMKQGQRKTKQ